MKTQANEPCAFITKRKQRIKQINQAVYLNNGDEFEIELFNPRTNKLLAVIQLNGKNISDAGIVLRPGERVFLERFLDSRRKFLFETYNVSGGSDEVKRAIEHNGKVSVKFYDEAPYESPDIHHKFWYNSVPDNISPFYGPVYGMDNTGTPPSQMFYTSSITTDCLGDSHTLTKCCGSASNTSSYDDALSFLSQDFQKKSTKLSRSAKSKKKSAIETGRVEKGSHSQQSFVEDNTKFNSFYTWESDWQIYPISQKQRTISELNEIHCTGCGIKRKKDSHKFCPLCGTQYE